MGRMRRVEEDGLYERVLQRVARALERAEREGDEPLELELEGLSEGELAFVRAYLQRDARWLSGWHAAAHEQARLARRARLGRVVPVDPLLAPAPPVALDCALCGTRVSLPRRSGLVVCSACGSALMKAFKDDDAAG